MSDTDRTKRPDLRTAARDLLHTFADEPAALLPSYLNRIRALAGADVPIYANDLEAVSLIGRRSQTDVRGGVAIVPLQGVITPRGGFLDLLFGGGGGLQGFRSNLAEALQADEVNSIVLDVNSPGGSVSLVTEVAAELRAARGIKPITAVANTMAASAAYQIAAQADEVVVTPSGQTGSIGTYLVHTDWSKFNADLGVAPTYVYAGKYKVEANADEPLDDEARAALQASVDEHYGQFVADVAAGRGVSAAEVRAGYGEGRVLNANAAVAAKLADRVATIDDVVVELAGGKRRSSSSRSRSEAAGLTADVQARLTELGQYSPPIAH